MSKLAIVAVILCATASLAQAENAACWADKNRTDITCVALTEKLLLGLRGQSIAAVRKRMKAPGVERQANGLHFLSNGKSGSGTVDIAFDDGRAVTVSALVDADGKVGNVGYTWSAYDAPIFGDEIDLTTKNFARTAYCSDFSDRPEPCRGRDLEGELDLAQMQFGLSRAQMVHWLDSTCRVPGLQVNDPRGDCTKLRRRLTGNLN